jgi:4-hydroxybenzoate polyprenyltransferase
LFPYSDLWTMIVPVTLLGTFSALSGQFSAPVAIGTVLCRVPLTFLWVWLNVLVFSISNQRSQESVDEDRINKPWRPIPAGRISEAQARVALIIAIPLLLMACSVWLGATEETAYCLVLTWVYNDLGGANDHFLLRNGINGIAYYFYGVGAMHVATGHVGSALESKTCSWFGMVTCIITTTMQVQDLKDQEGDRARKRSTLPLDIGDSPCRWSIVIGLAAWSIISPAYWSLSRFGFAFPVLSGLLVAYRILKFRNPVSDRQTYRLWSAWLMTIFSLPLIVS